MTHTGNALLEADALTGTLAEALGHLDREGALGEAQFAVLEAAVNLIHAGQPQYAQLPLERAELLREALGAARAAVVATGVALAGARPAAALPV